MQRINLIAFYHVGVTVGKLLAVATSAAKLNDWRWSQNIEGAQRDLESFIAWKDEDSAVLPKTAQAATNLLSDVRQFSKILGEERPPTESETGPITNAIHMLYQVFEQESQDFPAYLVTPVGAYSATALHENASVHLSRASQALIDDEQKLDFNKAGACLSLDLYTGCGFHAMRAVEAEARTYHKIVTGVSLGQVPIGTIINGNQKEFPGSGLKLQHAEEGSTNDSPLGLVISLLSQVNAIYRRPVMHPQMILDFDMAKLVFDLSAVVISTMVADGHERLKRLKEAKSENVGISSP